MRFKGMDGVFCVSQERPEGCEEPVDVDENQFPLDEYSRVGHGDASRGENRFSSLSVMKQRRDLPHHTQRRKATLSTRRVAMTNSTVFI